MAKALYEGRSIPINATAVYTIQNGWEAVSEVVAERDQLKEALDLLLGSASGTATQVREAQERAWVLLNRNPK